jgi:hypothetical protein
VQEEALEGQATHKIADDFLYPVAQVTALIVVPDDTVHEA